MNKKNPDQIRAVYQNEADALLQFYADAIRGLLGRPHEKKNLTVLSESVFLNAYVAFETFLSDLFLAYINKKSQPFQNKKERQMRELVRDEIGDWYGQRLQLAKKAHLTADEVESLLDPQGFNLTFSGSTHIKKRAGDWLAPEHRRNIFTLTNDDFAFIDCCKEVRNGIAHKSRRSIEAMNNELLTVPSASTIGFMHRPSRKVRTIGVFLKSRHNGRRRVVQAIERLSAISSRM